MLKINFHCFKKLIINFHYCKTPLRPVVYFLGQFRDKKYINKVITVLQELQWTYIAYYYSSSIRGVVHPIIWPKRVCAAQQGMVFRVLRLKQGMQFNYISVLDTWTGSLEPYMWVPAIFHISS